MNEQLMTDRARLEMQALQSRAAALEDDLAQLVDLPAGRRVIVRLLQEDGLGSVLSCEPSQVASMNRAIFWLERIKKVNPKAALQILAETFELGDFYND